LIMFVRLTSVPANDNKNAGYYQQVIILGDHTGKDLGQPFPVRGMMVSDAISPDWIFLVHSALPSDAKMKNTPSSSSRAVREGWEVRQ
jgi:hypothetical protein